MGSVAPNPGHSMGKALDMLIEALTSTPCLSTNIGSMLADQAHTRVLAQIFNLIFLPYNTRSAHRLLWAVS